MFSNRHSLLAIGTVATLLTGCGVPAGTGLALPRAEAGTTSSQQGKSTYELHLDREVFKTRTLRSVVAQGPGVFDNALAMSVPYGPIASLRQEVQRALGRPLTFFKGWNPAGEAHVTVITPIEYHRMAEATKAGQPGLSMAQIGEMAAAAGIQSADLAVSGIGSGRKAIDGQVEETFFMIVESKALRQIRHRIHARYVAGGGDPKAFDPDRFFPHITIGFTKRDLHEADGILKDVANSLDLRFTLRLNRTSSN